MPTSTSGRFGGAPNLGPRVVRQRLLAALERSQPDVVLITAPSGYGKTFLASQFASTLADSTTVWIDCLGEALAGEPLLETVRTALADIWGGEEQAIPHMGEGLADGVIVDDSLAALRLLLRETSPSKRACLVLDDLRLEDAHREVGRLTETLRRSEARVTLVLTCREVPVEALSSLSGFYTLELGDLRLDEAEAAELVRLIGGDYIDSETTDMIIEFSGGQAALVSVLARHSALNRGGAVGWLNGKCPMNLSSLLLSLAEHQLGETERQLLYVLGVLGRATRAELQTLRRGFQVDHLVRIAERIPLVRVSPGHSRLGDSAEMHSLAQGVYSSVTFASSLECGTAPLFRDCLPLLQNRGDFERVLSLLAERASDAEVADWLDANGSMAVAHGCRIPVKEAISALPAGLLLSRPRLLLTAAELDADLSLAEEALAKASAARELARCEGQGRTEVDALLLMSKVLMDQGRLAEAWECLEEMAAMPETQATNESRLLNMCYLLALSAMRLDAEQTRTVGQRVVDALDRMSTSPVTRATVSSRRGIVAFLFGDASEALSLYAEVQEMQGMTATLIGTAMGNRATMLMELGRLDHGLEVARNACEHAAQFGLEPHHAAAQCVEAAIRFTTDGGSADIERIQRMAGGFHETGDRTSEAFARLYVATMLRSADRVDESMVQVERTLEHASHHSIAYHHLLAEVELAANFLSLGDLEAAARHAAVVRERCAPAGAFYHVIRADMVLAEVARRQGRIEEARSRLLDHEAYILSESPNWSISMYVRAFPHLLGLIVSALGVASLPANMLRMITGCHSDNALIAARELLDEGEWRLLASRMLGEESSDRIEALCSIPPCRVRMFGGLEVLVGTRQVTEREWRKRKARLLFAMLVLNQGRDVPRDRVCEHLWPEMEEERARNNLYVIWSAMKAALMPGAGKSTPCSYVEHVGGVCRSVSAYVTSDVAEFDVLCAKARQAEMSGDPEEALRCYERLVDSYKGELLPGDVYDDWFSSARDHYRQEFSDAMLSAHRLMCVSGDQAGALRLIRRAIAADPWREDLYQAALRSQIACGQRNAAIETYATCRSRLGDQLGLDPSEETTHLYEQVLAMEERRSEEDSPL